MDETSLRMTKLKCINEDEESQSQIDQKIMKTIKQQHFIRSILKDKFKKNKE